MSEPEAWPFDDEHPEEADDLPNDDNGLTSPYRSEMAETPKPIKSDDGKAAGRATFIR